MKRKPELASIDLTDSSTLGQQERDADGHSAIDDDTNSGEVHGGELQAGVSNPERTEQARGRDGGSPHEEHAGQQGPETGGDQDHTKDKKKKVLSEKKIQRMKELYNKRGVVYVSRIPPHMKPMKLKQLLSAHGDTLRVYCAPEDPRARKLRKRKGGNTGKNFTEGWVEFADKRVAKRTALALNGQRIGGKRRSAYYDDLWCIKYLPRFKWDDLTEEIAYQRAVHEQKMAAEVAAAKKERDFYLQQVDRAKGMRAIAERRAAKQAGAGQQGPNGVGGAHSDSASVPQQGSAADVGGNHEGGNKKGSRTPFSRNFTQRAAKADPTTDAAAPQLAEDVLLMVGKSKKKPRVE